MLVLQIGKRQLLLLCVGLILVVAVAILAPLVILGVAVGYGAGVFCVKRWPSKFNRFHLPVSKDKQRIKELEAKVLELQGKAHSGDLEDLPR